MLELYETNTYYNRYYYILIAILIFISYLLTTIDKLMNSECIQCGYAIITPTLPNPLDEAFKYLSDVFPIDLIFLLL